MKSFDTFLVESGSLALSTVAGHSTGWVAKAVDTLKERGYQVAPSTAAKSTLHATKGEARCMIEVDPITGLVTKVQVGDNAPVMQPFNKDVHADGTKRSFKSEGDKMAYMKGLDDALASIKADGSQGKGAESRDHMEGSTPGQTMKESFEVFGLKGGKPFTEVFLSEEDMNDWLEFLDESTEVHGKKKASKHPDSIHSISGGKDGTFAMTHSGEHYKLNAASTNHKMPKIGDVLDKSKHTKVDTPASQITSVKKRKDHKLVTTHGHGSFKVPLTHGAKVNHFLNDHAKHEKVS